MATIQGIVRSINRELVPLFEERPRAELASRDREWLIDQVVRLTLDAHALQEMDRRSVVEASARARRERLARVSGAADHGGSPVQGAALDFIKASTELCAAGTW